MKKPKVVVQYPFIPLYRIPVFRKLAASERYDFVFWTGKGSLDKFLKSTFDESGLPVEEVPLKILRIPVINKIFEFQFSAIPKLIKTRPDVYIILANPNSLTSWLCMLMARLVGSKVLAWSHGFLSDEKGLKGYIRTFFYKIPHGHLLYGNNAKDIMVRKGFFQNKLDVIYNSLDYEVQSHFRDSLGIQDRIETRKKLNISENDIVLITIGRLLPKLKINEAIHLVMKLTNEHKEVSLLIVGDGPEMGRLVDLSKSLGINNRVVFYGACYSEEELSRLFNASDMSISMGTIGLSAMHSLGYGVPCIANLREDKHGPEIESIIENETGWFYDPADMNSVVKKIKQIPYKGTYYKKCIELIEDRYTPAKQCQNIEKIISKYLGVD